MGLCIALSFLDMPTTEGVRKRIEVGNLINARIEPYPFATYWLAWRVVAPRYRAKDFANWPKTVNDRILYWVDTQPVADLQAWRHAWLDELIKEFESKGD
jgi:hypothetical protein